MKKNEENYQQRMSDEQGQVGHNSAWGEPDASLPKVPKPVKSNKTMKLNGVDPKTSFRLVNDWRVYCIKTPAMTEDTIPQAGYILTYPDDIHVIAGWWPNDTEVIPVDDISDLGKQLLEQQIRVLTGDIPTRRTVPIFGQVEHALVQPVDVYNTLEEIAEDVNRVYSIEGIGEAITIGRKIWYKLKKTIDAGAYIKQNGTE